MAVSGHSTKGGGLRDRTHLVPYFGSRQHEFVDAMMNELPLCHGFSSNYISALYLPARSCKLFHLLLVIRYHEQRRQGSRENAWAICDRFGLSSSTLDDVALALHIPKDQLAEYGIMHTSCIHHAYDNTSYYIYNIHICVCVHIIVHIHYISLYDIDL